MAIIKSIGADNTEKDLRTVKNPDFWCPSNTGTNFIRRSYIHVYVQGLIQNSKEAVSLTEVQI
jgi:hypothetical protein